ncbi:hypothetical protein E1I69_13135 [Bacillus timonensis]|uniref:N-acetylmuramoyl-L-alanine amidase n=2 Tax=Bacillus timonensis TaxID=1033734 RepID=A0A4S3PQN2_9BACI|nr:hypothetical protein E1I69_13135 [Bacillus timonensis]
MYQITRDYIRTGNSRSGQKISKVRFIVSHDTGNPGSTAYQNWNYFNKQQPSASAHTFIDDKYILEIIPLNEKAWHVQYNKPTDNRLFGADANDAAIGVELCWGGSINFKEAYKRYVWYHAHLCKTFSLDPRKHIVAHKTLDPERRTDPVDCLKRHGITWEQFINEVVKEMSPKGSIAYQAHLESLGWQGKRKDGQTAGTIGQRRRLEALTVKLEGSNAELEMQGHVEGKGWTTPRTNGEIIGTMDEGLRLEAIKIKCSDHNVLYRVHVQSIGWTEWKKNGEIAGTTGQSKRIEAVEIKLA